MRGRAEWNLKTSCVIMIVSTRPVLRLIIYMTGHGKAGDGAASRAGGRTSINSQHWDCQQNTNYSQLTSCHNSDTD